MLLLLAVEARAQERPPTDATPPAPSQATPAEAPLLAIDGLGWRLTSSFSGGWDSNVFDTEEPTSDYEYSGGVRLSHGARSRRGVLGFALAGSGLWYAQTTGRDTFQGSADLAFGRRLSRRSTFGLTGNYNYGYSDSIRAVNEAGLPLPRTRTWTGRGLARFDHFFSSRTRWAFELGYDRYRFSDTTLVDTDSTRLETRFSRAVAAHDDLFVAYSFSYTWWEQFDSPYHTGYAGWKHGFSRRWFLELYPGVTWVRPPEDEAADHGMLVPFGGASIGFAQENASFTLSYRLGVTPGYGLGETLHSDTVNLTTLIPVGKDSSLTVAGTYDHSQNPFDPESRFVTIFADVQFITRLRTWMQVVVGYRFRRRESESVTLPVNGHRAGLSFAFTAGGRR